MATVFIGLGSNLGNRRQHLKEALHRVAQLPQTRLKDVSAWIETSAIGGPAQGKYLNGVARIQTALAPLKLLRRMQQIERQMGRPKKGIRWGPRVIDLDMLSYEDLVLKGKTLTLPHPRMHGRAFVLLPLSRLSPGWKHPVFKLTAKELLCKLSAAPRN